MLRCALGGAPVQPGRRSRAQRSGTRDRAHGQTRRPLHATARSTASAVRFMVDTGATAVSHEPSTTPSASASTTSRRAARHDQHAPTATCRCYGVDADAAVRDRRREGLRRRARSCCRQPMPLVLLGNSFLTRFQMRRENDVMTLDAALERGAAPAACRRARQGNIRTIVLKTASSATRSAPGDMRWTSTSPPKNRPSAKRSAPGCAANLPETSAHKVHNALRLTRDDHAALGQDPGQEGLARLGLAQAVRRPGLERGAEAPVRGRMRAGRRAARDPVRPGDGGAGDHGLRHARAAAALPARHRQRRGLVEPGLQRAGLGLRPRLAEDPRRARGRQLHRQRPEDLDHARPVRRLDLLPGAHQHRGQAADRHQLPADRHEEPRRHGAADHHCWTASTRSTRSASTTSRCRPTT